MFPSLEQVVLIAICMFGLRRSQETKPIRTVTNVSSQSAWYSFWRQDRTGEVHTKRARWGILPLLPIASVRHRAFQPWFVRRLFQLILASCANADQLRPTRADKIRDVSLQFCSQAKVLRADRSSLCISQSCRHDFEILYTKFPENARHQE